LPICDEFVVAVGDSEDGTLDRILALNDTKIKIIEKTTWDEKLRTGGNILAQQTNIALANITGDWGIYLQADEVVHEKYLPVIKEAVQQNLDDRRVEGLLLKYIHFYGSYDYYANSRSWYRQEIRVIRNNIGVQSWKDAQGFRIDNRKMNVKFVDAYVNHYGWVKHPKIMQDKVVAFNKLWHEDKWVEQNIPQQNEFDFSIIESIQKFEETHPQVMADRITKYNWSFSPPINQKQKIKQRLPRFIEEKTNLRIGEYKNYKLIK
ncbi:MAG: glycosyltransferase family 2 protein, partial [Bacteroidetes bacterium]|nr:glycosyltransferase family 2 protein [Bacteroidota bacterium]MBU1423815.1 glycosyltransferase family 2 protein [Bacteroidota bacterium]